MKHSTRDHNNAILTLSEHHDTVSIHMHGHVNTMPPLPTPTNFAGHMPHGTRNTNVCDRHVDVSTTTVKNAIKRVVDADDSQ